MKRANLKSLTTVVAAICMTIICGAPRFTAPAAVQRRIMK